MDVLVTAASRHGSTVEVAERIGHILRTHGLIVDVCPLEEHPYAADFDAVVLGSAVYLGRWLEPAVEFVVDQHAALAARPVWLFSSGPVGRPLEPGEPSETTVHVTDLEERVRACGHRLFGGKLERRLLSFAEAAVVTALGTPDGDFRDWNAIETWATEIAGELRRLTSARG